MMDVIRAFNYEVLMCLEGIGGDLFTKSDTNFLQLNGSRVKSMFGTAHIEMLNNLCEVSNDYLLIGEYVCRHKTDVCAYKRQLSHALECVLHSYRTDLMAMESDINESPNYSLTKFNQFLKYSKTFALFKQTILKLSADELTLNSCVDVFGEHSLSGWTHIRDCATLAFNNYDTTLDDIWSWIVYGYLRPQNEVHYNFFVKQSVHGMISLDINSVPSFMSVNTAKSIFNIGLTVRSANKSIFSDSELELFECFSEVKRRSVYDRIAFAKFVETARKIVAKYKLNYIVNEQNLIKHLIIIKDIYLTAEESAWIRFVSNCFAITLNGDQHNQRGDYNL